MHALLTEREAELNKSVALAREKEERACVEKRCALDEHLASVEAYQRERDIIEDESALQILGAAANRVSVLENALRASAETHLQSDALPIFKRDAELQQVVKLINPSATPRVGYLGSTSSFKQKSSAPA